MLRFPVKLNDSWSRGRGSNLDEQVFDKMYTLMVKSLVIEYTSGEYRLSSKAYGVVTAIARGLFVRRTVTLVQGAKDQGYFKAIMNSIGTALLVIVVGCNLQRGNISCSSLLLQFFIS